MKRNTGFLLVMVLLAFDANALDVGIGVKAGSLGAGVDLSVALTQTINARVSLTGVDIDDQNESITVGDSSNTGQIDATLDFDFGASSLLLDWYVFDGTFHISAGMLKNNGRIGFSGLLVDDATFGSTTISPSDLDGPITGTIGAGESYEPYVGIGWGRKASRDSGLSLSVEIGVALLEPRADLNATQSSGSVIPSGNFSDAIDEAEADVNEDLSELEAWPVISIGLNYAF